MNYNRGGDPVAELTAKHQKRIAELEEALIAKDKMLTALQEELNKKVKHDSTTIRSRSA